MSRLQATSLATSYQLRAAGATSYESQASAWARHPTTQGIQIPSPPPPLSRDQLQAMSDRSYEPRTHELLRAWRPASHAHTPSLRLRAPLSRDQLQATSDRSYEPRTHELLRAWRPASNAHTPSLRSRAPLSRDQLQATSHRSYEPRTHELL